MTIYIDNTMIAAYRRCPRAFFFRHRKHWRGVGTSLPLAFGLAWHEAMDAVWGLAHSHHNDRAVHDMAMAAWEQTWIEQGLPTWDSYDPQLIAMHEPRTPAVAYEMLFNYIKRRRPMIQEGEVVSIEQPFEVPLDPSRPDLRYIGRLDKVAKVKGKLTIIEHKTTSAYSKAAGFRQEYIESYSPNSQVDGYLHGGRMHYQNEHLSVMVDAALVHKMEHDVFKLIPINRATAMLDSWLNETISWIDRIEADDKRLALEVEAEQQFMSAFPKNTNACWDYHSECTYRNLCRYCPAPHLMEETPEGMVVEEWKPYEILTKHELKE